MSSLTEPRRSDGTLVNYTEPAIKPAPRTTTGIIAWVRENLFRTAIDSVMTLVFGALLIATVSSFLVWAVRQANWYAITFNLRPLMVGRFQVDFEWRLILLVIIACIGVGLALAAWTHLRRWVLIAMIAVVALMFIVPQLINSLIPLPPAYFAAGQVEFGTGPTAERPQERVGFIAVAGETIRVQVAESVTANLDALRGLHSFGDDITGRLRNTAIQRFTTQARAAEIDSLLAGESLTENQRSRLLAEQERLTIPGDILAEQRVNQEPVTVRILNGSTLEALAEAELTPGSAPIVLTVPEDGWYILEKLVVDEDSVALLETRGIYPLLQRSLTRRNDQGAVERIDQFTRVTDTYTSEAIRPRWDGRDLPFVTLINNQYRGEHSFADYLRLYVDPFLAVLSIPALGIAVATAAGYGIGHALDRTFSSAEKPRQTSRRAATWVLASVPVLMFFLIYGLGNLLPLTDPRTWGGLLLTIVLTTWGIVFSLPLGILLALGRQSKAGVPLSPLLQFKWGSRDVRIQPKLPIVSLLCTAYIELVRGVPFITVLFMAQLLLPLINPALADFPGAFRATIATIIFSAAYLAETVRGGLQAIPHGQEEAAKALGLNGFQITTSITLPQALRIVIPAIMGSFVALFKDTSLVTIVGLLDLTGMADNITAQNEFLGLRSETLMFISIIYFVFCWGMAAVSRKLETSGAGSALKQEI
mgnify:CR=1 FL=1|jgi:general L-amino acid transport system permease protein